MPTVDLETLMSACAGGSSDGKVACETAAGDLPPPPPEENFPPESFWLSKEAEFDWFDKNAFYNRNESLKGNSNSGQQNLSSTSQRYSIAAKTRASVLGLPKTQKTIENRKKNCKPSKVKMFPKRTGSMDKSAVQLPEPSSPKVSCMGRVKSKRKNRKKGEPVESSRTGRERSKGICKQLFSMFRSDQRSKPAIIITNKEPEPLEFLSRMKVTVGTEGCRAEPEPPGLGAMKRFASGWKSSSSATEQDWVFE